MAEDSLNDLSSFLNRHFRRVSPPFEYRRGLCIFYASLRRLRNTLCAVQRKCVCSSEGCIKETTYLSKQVSQPMRQRRKQPGPPRGGTRWRDGLLDCLWEVL